ncbi:MAG: thymidine phosphorylase [Veillonellaceae bacterium]|nr:thymidine phosphorylase [Veillonellaceae bacterium]
MDSLAVLRATRDGEALTEEQIREFIRAYVAGDVPDYQVAAWLMAVYFRGLSRRETIALTLAMRDSGDTLSFEREGFRTVDKHSTGGVADTTTLIIAPLVAACGGYVGKMSGRGLGFTGGTLDKLEAVPGLRTDLTEGEFFAQVRDIGVAVVGQTRELAPADGLLYALRDVTETVASLPLVASSVMSKKLAGGADGIVLDVKCGRAAFMQSRREAELLAELMVAIGREAGRRMTAFVTDMNLPLGSAVGNSLEIDEAVEVLQGGGNRRLRELSLALAGAMLAVAGVAEDAATGEAIAAQALADGRGMERFERWLAAQGGETKRLGREPLTKRTNVYEVTALADGYVSDIDAMLLARTGLALGAGRRRKGDRIDPQVGLALAAQPGDYVRRGDLLLTIYGKAGADLRGYEDGLRRAFVLGEGAVEPPLIYERLE